MIDTQQLAEAMAADIVTELQNAVASGQPVDPQRLTAVFAKAMESGEMKAFTLRAQAMGLQQQAGELLDEADRLEHREQLRLALAAYTQPLEQAWAAEDALIEAAKQAVTAERAAEDRALAAVEHHRLAVEAERKGHGKAGPDQQTEALLRMRAAADVMAREQAAFEGARTARARIDVQLADARRSVAALEASQERAAVAVKNPGTAPQSSWTGLLDGPRRLAFGVGLDADAMGAARLVVGQLADVTGIARTLRAEGRAQVEKELQAKAHEAQFLPRPGHKLRPAEAGQVFVPLPPRVG